MPDPEEGSFPSGGSNNMTLEQSLKEAQKQAAWCLREETQAEGQHVQRPCNEARTGWFKEEQANQCNSSE